MGVYGKHKYTQEAWQDLQRRMKERDNLHREKVEMDDIT
jgi:isocitrate dehydrogenase kinase/phosphatase